MKDEIAENFEKFSNFFIKNDKIIYLIIMGLFMYLTILGISVHEPWLDEAQAWLIAQDLNFFELLKHMKYEGHMFLWFLALMPSAKLNLPYPMPMLITNLIFIWATVFIFLKKAPLHPLLKLPIVFSMPIAYQYGVIARPYAMSVMFLFALATLYKDKLKRPYLYCSLIVLCANTSAMALFGAAAFGGLFLWDYLKEKKEFWKSKEFYIILSIALFGIWILGYQLLGAGKQVDVYESNYIYNKDFNFIWYALYEGLCRSFVKLDFYRYLVSAMFLIFTIGCFWKNKKTFFFFLTTNLALSAIFLNLYNGYQWHHFFFYIYLIVSIWLFNINTEGEKKGIFYKLLIIFLMFISLIFDKITVQTYNYDIHTRTSNSKILAQKILQDEKMKNDYIATCDEVSTTVVPYLRNYNIEAYSCFDGKKASFFNRSYGKPLTTIKKNTLSPMYFQKFEDKPIHLILQNGPQTEMQSDYYALGLDFCSAPAPSDGVQFCVINLTKGY